MRVAYLCVSAQPGGAERALLDLLAGLRAAEPSWPLLLVLPGDGPVATRARALGAGVRVLPFPPRLRRAGDFPEDETAPAREPRIRRLARLAGAALPAARHRQRLARLLAEFRPDLVHGNGLKADLLGAWSCPPGVPVVWHVHDYVSPRPLASRLFRWSASRAAAAVAVSRSVADDVRAVCGGKLACVALHNPVDLAEFAPSGPRADLDALSGLAPAPPGTVRVGLVATMARWKGHEVFLRALAMLPPSLDVRGYVVGGPIYETERSQVGIARLRDVARGAGVADRVGFTGFVDRPAEAIRALDVVVHASTKPEPFGLVVAEGMASGRAVIAAAAGGVCEFIHPAENVLVHRPGDAADLAAQIARLAGDEALRARLGHAGRRAAIERFDCRTLAAELLAVYRRAGSPDPVAST
jgi:glycosyltransferase involved in cell wall biosynthesis